MARRLGGDDVRPAGVVGLAGRLHQSGGHRGPVAQCDGQLGQPPPGEGRGAALVDDQLDAVVQRRRGGVAQRVLEHVLDLEAPVRERDRDGPGDAVLRLLRGRGPRAGDRGRGREGAHEHALDRRRVGRSVPAQRQRGLHGGLRPAAAREGLDVDVEDVPGAAEAGGRRRRRGEQAGRAR